MIVEGLDVETQRWTDDTCILAIYSQNNGGLSRIVEATVLVEENDIL